VDARCGAPASTCGPGRDASNGRARTISAQSVSWWRVHIGEIRGARVSTARNILPGFTAPVGNPLSPAPMGYVAGAGARHLVPYEPTRGLYHFRWFWDYSGGQTTNLLAHEVDIVQWVTGPGAAARGGVLRNAGRSQASAKRRTSSKGSSSTPGSC
jgi:hypothetical protein